MSCCRLELGLFGNVERSEEKTRSRCGPMGGEGIKSSGIEGCNLFVAHYFNGHCLFLGWKSGIRSEKTREAGNNLQAKSPQRSFGADKISPGGKREEI